MQYLPSSDAKVADMLHGPDQVLLKRTGALIILIFERVKISITELLTQQLPNNVMYGVAP